MLSLKETLAIMALVFVIAMVAWDWVNKPNGVILPAKDDEDDWHDWPPSGVR